MAEDFPSAPPGLNHLNAVKWIAVYGREIPHTDRILEFDGKDMKPIIIEDAGEIVLKVVSQAKFPKARFDGGFPDGGDADIARPIFIDHDFSDLGAEILFPLEKTYPGVRIHHVAHMYSRNSSSGASKSSAI